MDKSRQLTIVHELWKKAIAADEQFSEILRHRYHKSACEHRYKPRLWDDYLKAKWQDVERAMKAWQDACHAYAGWSPDSKNAPQSTIPAPGSS